MFGIGMPEMILILAIALIVIGPQKLPDLAKSIGRALNEFKSATHDLKASMEIDTELKEVKDAFDDMNKDVRKAIEAPPDAGKAGSTGEKAEKHGEDAGIGEKAESTDAGGEDTKKTEGEIKEKPVPEPPKA